MRKSCKVFPEVVPPVSDLKAGLFSHIVDVRRRRSMYWIAFVLGAVSAGVILLAGAALATII